MKPFSELKIALASDHAGFALKNQVRLFLEDNGAQVYDFGCYSADSCDYPDYAHPLAEAVSTGEYEYGIAICSTGNGICMTANKHQGIRAALCSDVYSAKMTKQHNNANIICMGGRVIGRELAFMIVDVWLETEFEGGRHANRIAKIHEIEK